MSGLGSEDLAASFKNWSELAESFELSNVLPNIQNIMGNILVICRILILVGPILLLVLGLSYYFLAPKEANWYFGYRCYFGMGSPTAWQYTQHLAGLVFGGLGLVLTVAMIVMCIQLGGAGAQSAVWTTLYCLAIQAALSILATLFINLWTMNCFDSKGRIRKKKA